MVRSSLWSGTPLRGHDEDEVLADVVPRMPGSPALVVPPGDDAAVFLSSLATVATTDTMVLDRDWRDDWSSGADVGRKIVVSNLADIAAMGAVPTGVLVTLVVDPAASIEWLRDVAEGVSAACREAQVAVLGGDLSSATPGVAMVSVTALGEQRERPVLRSGARPGDLVAVHGSLGLAAAGLELLVAGAGAGGVAPADRSGSTTEGLAARCIGHQRRPASPLAAGPEAARAGATSMMDVSDGLVRDAGRIARASDVVIELDREWLAPFYDLIEPVVGREGAIRCVLGGGEEHSLLATFPAGRLPEGWRRVGHVRANDGRRDDSTDAGRDDSTDAGRDGTTDAGHGGADGGGRHREVLVDGRRWDGRGGWDHFEGR